MSINIFELAVSYGKIEVIADLNLGIEQGRLFTLLGPSGCGKTTLLRTIAGFVESTRGSIFFGDKDVTRLPAHKRDIGMVFQDYALFPNRSVFENVAYGLRARGEQSHSIASRVNAALERVDLGKFADRKPAALSGGQRQRVALARALVIKPQVLLMDEPLSNLDAKLRVQVRETIMELQRESEITTVFVTHDQEEALSMSDMIGVMNKGRIEQLGSPKDIYATPATSYVADFVGSANRLKVVPLGKPNNNRIEVALSEVRLTGICHSDIKESSAVLALRPEDLELKSTDDGDFTMPGTIIQRQYIGAKTSYKVRILDGTVISVDLHSNDHDRFKEGQDLFVAINPEKAVVLGS